MRCSRCEHNNAKYTVEYSTDFGVVKEFLCEECYLAESAAHKTDADAVILQNVDLHCPFCGNGMDDYLRSGLVGCAQCYEVFATELEPYVTRAQGDGEHKGKFPPKDPKFEAADTLRELLEKQKEALKKGNRAQALKMERKAEELKLILFGDEGEE